MQLFSLLEAFANSLVGVLSNIQSIFFNPLGDVLRNLLADIPVTDPLFGFGYLINLLFSFRGAIDNVLGIDLLFFLDFSLSMFLLPTVIIVFVVVLFVIAVWKLILELIPFV